MPSPMLKTPPIMSASAAGWLAELFERESCPGASIVNTTSPAPQKTAIVMPFIPGDSPSPMERWQSPAVPPGKGAAQACAAHRAEQTGIVAMQNASSVAHSLSAMMNLRSATAKLLKPLRYAVFAAASKGHPGVWATN